MEHRDHRDHRPRSADVDLLMRYCEAMVWIEAGKVWTRCGKAPVEKHHRLTRARGGKLLDAVGETYHLMDLCREHHIAAHAPGGTENGLMLDGYVTTGPQGLPVYEGPDEYLSTRYPARPLPMSSVRGDEAGDDPSERLRGET